MARGSACVVVALGPGVLSLQAGRRYSCTFDRPVFLVCFTNNKTKSRAPTASLVGVVVLPEAAPRCGSKLTRTVAPGPRRVIAPVCRSVRG